MDESGDIPQYHYIRQSGPEAHPKSSESHVAQDSEFWAAHALACDIDEPVMYCPDVMKEPIDDWLKANRPSILSRSDGVGWIIVFAPSSMRTADPDVKKKDKIGLQAAWKSYQKSGKPINKNTFTNLAKNFHATCGKWLFYVNTGDKVDYSWAKVVKAVVSGTLCDQAKISPFDPSGDGAHVCCMYNDDFTNEDEVIAFDKRIRDSGIYTTLRYKPDIYTYLGIYRHNEWNIRPTIYESVFDVISRQSRVTPVE